MQHTNTTTMWPKTVIGVRLYQIIFYISYTLSKINKCKLNYIMYVEDFLIKTTPFIYKYYKLYVQCTPNLKPHFTYHGLPETKDQYNP